MKRFNSLSLQQKLWLTISAFLMLAVLLLYAVAVYIYENIYITNVEQRLLQEGMNIAAKYKGGALTDSFRNTVSIINDVSDTEIVLVNNPRELSACLPFEVDHHAIISEAERQQLLAGKTVTKKGYEQTFNRHIVGVIIPLLDEHRLMSILYLYVPLASIEDVLKRIQTFIIIGGSFFYSLLYLSDEKSRCISRNRCNICNKPPIASRKAIFPHK